MNVLSFYSYNKSKLTPCQLFPWSCWDNFQFVEIVQDVMIITKNRIKKGYVSLVQSTEVQPLSDCKGRALRKVQEKDSARVKGEAP